MALVVLGVCLGRFRPFAQGVVLTHHFELVHRRVLSDVGGPFLRQVVNAETLTV